MADVKWGKQHFEFEPRGRDVVLCDSREDGLRAAKAIAAALGVTVISGTDDVRGTFRDRLPKEGRDRVPQVLDALGLDDDALEWRLKDASPLRRLLAAAAAGVLAGERALVVELGSFTAMPFDLAHVYRHLRQLHSGFGIRIVVVIVDPALISSSGDYLTVLTERGIEEAAAVRDALADPQSARLLARLEATPVPNPLAMQQRRVQRARTNAVNYSHTQIVQLPTADATALAGGDITD